MSPQNVALLSSMFSAKSVRRSGNKRFGLHNMANLAFGRPKHPGLTLKSSRMVFFQENPPPWNFLSPVNIVNPGNRPPRNRRLRLMLHMLGRCVPLSQLDSNPFDDTVFFRFRNLADISKNLIAKTQRFS